MYLALAMNYNAIRKFFQRNPMMGEFGLWGTQSYFFVREAKISLVYSPFCPAFSCVKGGIINPDRGGIHYNTNVYIRFPLPVGDSLMKFGRGESN